MSEFKGTKGQWFVDLRNQEMNQFNILETPISTKEIKYFAMVYGNDDASVFDARLISCAPEMLEMLKIVLKDYETNILQSKARDSRIIDIEELIKKATEL